ncbi:late control protein [Empedobacter brevis]|uniref:late control protein n=1 Tax=Empedobacter brevis TaxID=247 RepID=UPI0025749CB6|nr:late control protein [Empedobacter brevis]
MLYVLESKIKIAGYEFNTITSVEITKSVDELTDTAIITMPAQFKVRQNGILMFTDEAIKVGDPVTITLGYERFYRGVEFRGFVSKVNPKIPIEIHCEDATWLLKRKNINKAWNKPVQLKEILQEVVKDTFIKLADNIPEMQIDKFIIQNANANKVLQKLKSEYGLSIYLNDNEELYVGLQQLNNIHQEVAYDLNYNLVENNLEYKTEESRKIKVRYTYIDKKNKKKTVEFGDDDGEIRTFHTSIISDEAKLKEMAKAELVKLKYEGFSGNVKSFLIPFATRGMTAKLINKVKPKQEGKYYINKVVTTFSDQGARRQTYITNKL